MPSLHVSLTVGHHASMPHLPCSLDPQMRVFWQRNLDPFDSSLSLTDLLRAAGNLLGLARSGLSWGRQFFAAPPFPGPKATKPSSQKPDAEREDRAAEDPKSPRPPEQPPSEVSTETLPPALEPNAERRMRRTREAGGRAAAEAQERLAKAPKEERSRKGAPERGHPYGLHLALELAIDRGRRTKPAGKEEERRSEGKPPGGGLPVSFRGTLSLHLPLKRPAPTERGGRGGR